MKNSKKLFTVTAMALCLSFCMGTISHAETMIKYKETNYGTPISNLKGADSFDIHINSSGRIVFNLKWYRS